MGGGKGGSGSNPSADALARMAQQMFQQTDPIRQALIGRSAGFLGIQPQPQQVQVPGVSPDKQLLDVLLQGDDQRAERSGDARNSLRFKQRIATVGQPQDISNYITPVLSVPIGQDVGQDQSIPRLDVTQSPMFGTLKNAIESQYGRARENVISSTPAGGGLVSALSNLERGRADALTTGIGGLAQDELNRAFSLATGGMQSGFGGLSNAANIQAQLAAADAQRNSAAKSGLGSAIGTGVGFYFGGPAGAAAGGAAGNAVGGGGK